MRNKLLLCIAVGIATVIMASCVKNAAQPVVVHTTQFSVTSKMTHSKDSIRNSGDTVVYSIQGSISDTSRKYGIAANMLAVDTTLATNQLTAFYTKSITVKFDTSGFAKSGLFHWTTSVSVYFPPIPSKTGIKTTGNFTFGLTLSSVTGNQLTTDSKTIHVK